MSLGSRMVRRPPASLVLVLVLVLVTGYVIAAVAKFLTIMGCAPVF